METKLWLVLILCTLGFSNEFFKYSDTLSKIQISKAECESKQHAVWVKANWVEKGIFSDNLKEAEACIRYFPSLGHDTSKTAVLYFPGDIDGDPEAYDKSANYVNYVQKAYNYYKKNKVASIIVGRPGTLGGSGMAQSERRLPIETYLVDAAITKIKEKYGYERVSIAGLSGGGGLVAAVLTLGRTDIDCAVIASGLSSVKTRTRTYNYNAYIKGMFNGNINLYEVYDPIDNINKIKKDEKRQVYVLADVADRQVSFESQKEFFDKLITVEEKSYLILLDTGEPKHHILQNEAFATASMCMLGKSVEDIQNKLTKK